MKRALVVVVVVTVLSASGCPAPEDPSPPSFATASFPETFAWGTATAGWQIEGDTGVNGQAIPSNWSKWMELGNGRAGGSNPDGNGFLIHFDDDAQRAADLGLTQFRLSIDWSRVQPEPGVVVEEELAHLEAVLDALVAHGLEPVLTLYHWTVPLWVQDPEAGLDRIADKDHAVVDDFEAFVRVVIPRVKDKVDTYTVLNEPLTMVVLGYVDGAFPPGRTLDIEAATDFGINLMYMHARAFDVIKDLDDVDANGDGRASFIGLTMTANDIYPERPGDAQEELAALSLNYVYNDWVIHALTDGALDVDLNGIIDPAAPTEPAEAIDDALANRLEFIGVQYYGPVKVKQLDFLDNVHPLYGLPLVDVADYSSEEDKALPKNGMGREINAAGFRDTLDRYAGWGLPLIMTENGTTTNRGSPKDASAAEPLVFDEEQAAMYLVTHLWEVGRAISDGIDVRGYYHWTLVDNYEWVEGRFQRFGAYTVDFTDPGYPRTLNKMGEALREVVAAGAVDEAIWDKYVLDRFPTDTTTAGVGATTSANPKP